MALSLLEGGFDAGEERAAQRLADAQLQTRLLAELVAHGPSGRLWREVQVDAAEYGVAVFMRWVRTGEVYARAAARRRVVTPPQGELTLDERRGLVNLVVAYGLDFFWRESLRLWRPDGGAALKTFFIGACLLQFKAAFDAWRPDSDPGEIAAGEITDDDVELSAPWLTPAGCDPCDKVVLTESTWDFVADVDDPVTRKILFYVAAGLNYPEIAERLGGGLTAAAVSARIQRLRGKHHPDRDKRLAGRGQEGTP